jgi:hypothetical protein
MPTNPGFHPDFDITQYPMSVRPGIITISRNFYVTRSFRHLTVGNSNYYAILVRPTDEFSIYVNTDREIVVLFATYDTFEIRTLEAYDEVYDLLESSRIDRSVRFLVSADDRIESVIKHYLDQHPEYPIIIPTTFNHLSGKEGNHLLAAVRRNYLIRDLYGYQNPLREESFFFGRQNVVNSVLDMAKSGQNSSLFGLRKSGKTSAIFAIQRKAKGFGCTVSVIDCQNPAVHARRYGDLLSYLITEIRRSTGQKISKIDLGDNQVEIADNFFQHMRTTVGNAKSSILLIFDEIENISPETAASPHWRNSNDAIFFWQTLRSFLQSESKGRVSLCIVGTSPHILETAKINGIDNPIYLYAQKKFIPNLSFEETKEMVERLGYFMGLEFSAALIADLHRDFGGHPFFTRQVCSKVHQLASTNRPLKVSNTALAQAKTEFFGQMESYLRDIIMSLKEDYADEFDILQAVVYGDRNEVSEFGREAPDLIDHLIGYGLVERVGEDFDIRLEAIKLALKNLFPRNSEDRWAEISRRRNAIETNIRTAMYHSCRSIPDAEWRSILESRLTKSRFERLSSLELGYLFSSKSSPLYISDLFMLLKDERILPYLNGRRAGIVAAMDIVNRYRKDAHAIVVSDAEMNAARAAFDQLEGEFQTP